MLFCDNFYVIKFERNPTVTSGYTKAVKTRIKAGKNVKKVKLYNSIIDFNSFFFNFEFQPSEVFIKSLSIYLNQISSQSCCSKLTDSLKF